MATVDASSTDLVKYDFDVRRARPNAEKWKEMGRKFGRDDLLPFWVADMDFRSAQPIVSALRSRAEEGIFGYTFRPDSYFKAVAQWFEHRCAWKIDTNSMVHIPLVMTGVSVYIRQQTSPGDNIILQPPVYYPFYDIIRRNNREVLTSPVRRVEGQYQMDYSDLEEKLAIPTTTMLVLSSPHNPTGRVWQESELRQLAELCLRHNVKVIADEVHADLVLGTNSYVPFQSLSEEFARNSMSIVSPSKTFNLSGLQQSIAVLPDPHMRARLVDELAVFDIERNNCFSLVGAEAGYRYGEPWLEQVLTYIRGNIDTAIEYCNAELPALRPHRPEGTYLLWIDCQATQIPDDELLGFMVNEARVGVSNGQWFGPGGDGHVRMSVACPRSLMLEGLDRIRQALQRRSNR